MDWMTSIIEEKIREAMRNGDFDNLPGAGKPLALDDDSHIPEDLRAGYRMLKNAGMIPEEMQLRKDVVRLQDLLACCRDDAESSRLRGELSVKKLRYESLMSARGWTGSAAFDEYERQIRDKLTEQ